MANRSGVITSTTSLDGSSSDYTNSPNDSSDSSLITPPSQTLTETGVGDDLVADQDDLVADQDDLDVADQDDLDVADLVPDVAGEDRGSSLVVLGGEGSSEIEGGDHINRDGDEDLSDDDTEKNDDYDDVDDELERRWSSSVQRMIKTQTRASETRDLTRKRCPYCGAKPGCVHNKDRLGLKFRP